MREIGTLKIGSNIMNLHIKRPRITVNHRIGPREAISGSHICKIADKKTAYNEGCLYTQKANLNYKVLFYLATPIATFMAPWRAAAPRLRTNDCSGLLHHRQSLQKTKVTLRTIEIFFCFLGDKCSSLFHHQRRQGRYGRQQRGVLHATARQ